MRVKCSQEVRKMLAVIGAVLLMFIVPLVLAMAVGGAYLLWLLWGVRSK
jgi:hypothetical protein